MLARLPLRSAAPGIDGLLTALPAVRALHVSREIISKLLKTSEISHLLHEGGIDFRDCFERQELVERLAAQQHALPRRVQDQLQQLLATRSTGGQQASAAAAAAAPSEGAGSSSGNSSSAGGAGQAEGAAHSSEGRKSERAMPHAAWDTAGPMTPLAAAEAAAAGKDVPLPAPVLGLYQDEQRTVQLYQRCRPSVVHIACTRLSGSQVGLGGLLLDPKQVPTNFGSGIVWDTQGHVVTNYHVIAGAHTMQVTLSNNKKYKASLKGREPDKDLAVLKIEAPTAELVPVAVGVSSKLVVGQKVYAIGNPFGLDHSLTAGIVSGLGRQMQSITGHTIRDVVQTDASINPGNSGGPLLDSQGQLIGVNTAATAHPVQSQGFGFAIPADTVRRIVNQLIKYGRVVRPGLGALCLHDVHSRQLLEGSGGVVLEGVVPGSGAAQAGLRGVTRDEFGNVLLGDVIVGVGAQAIESVEELVSAVEQFHMGDQVPIKLRRYSSRSPVDKAFTVLQLSVPLLHEAKAM